MSDTTVRGCHADVIAKSQQRSETEKARFRYLSQGMAESNHRILGVTVQRFMRANGSKTRSKQFLAQNWKMELRPEQIYEQI